MDAAEVGEFLSDKRARKKGKRQARKWKARLAHNLHQEQLEDAFGKRSKIIKMLADEYDFDNDTIRATDYRPKRNNHGGTVARTGRFVVSVPHNFSIIEEPSLALATIGNFAKTIQQSQIRSVVLDHSRVQKYDLAANSLLDIIAVELKQQTRRSNRKVRWEGRYPKDPHINRFIRALGIIKHLEVEHEYNKPVEASKLRVFDECNRHYYGSSQPREADFKSKKVAAFADHIEVDP